ncbi:MAG: putative membrane protein (TIGR00267 family) [Methanobacteriota archaeon]|jgi:predicted membrane protein (TIGR00267 family)|uniref:TIGR00267 family protein n=1 Tax=Halorutilus salinus TaxID=2487751 RepID=A0A9Q4C2M8_9EURY|nr:VIT1/CCC1 transporter family protein [Halorutilus salinus]MCX2817825.1 hypothetical protein [Halorutilus salinus]
MTRISEVLVDPISRRYFVSNGFDGALTSVGIVVGAYLSGVPDGFTVVKIGVGAAVGLGTSGFWSVWEIEKAEKLAELYEIEESMLEDLDETRPHLKKREARRSNAFMSGLGPILAVLLTVSPFLFEGEPLGMLGATLVSVGVAVAVLFALGAYMGKLSRRAWYVAGARMGLAGVFVALINVLLPG